ncbi:cupin domain-containing protein [bacterium]|nr:cupin domain-containing protein [bacterium]
MSKQLIQIAKRLKRIREENEMSLEWAAAALESSPAELQAFESGEEEIPVSFLYMAAKKYGVDLSELLTGEEPQLKLFALTRKGKGVSVDRQKEYDYQSLCTQFAHKKVEPLLVTVPPEPQTAESHFNSHSGQEFHYVLKGRLQVTIDQESVVLEPGDALMFQSEVRHALKALDDKPAEVLVIIV